MASAPVVEHPDVGAIVGVAVGAMHADADGGGAEAARQQVTIDLSAGEADAGGYTRQAAAGSQAANGSQQAVHAGRSLRAGAHRGKLDVGRIGAGLRAWAAMAAGKR